MVGDGFGIALLIAGFLFVTKKDSGGLEMENQELLTIKEMAARLKVPPSWLYARTRIKDSDFPVIRVGKYCRFEAGAVMDWIEKQSQMRG